MLCLRSGVTSDWFSESNFTHGTTNQKPYPDLGSERHQYGISVLVSYTSFRGETVGGVVKYRLFSQATFASQIEILTAVCVI